MELAHKIDQEHTLLHSLAIPAVGRFNSQSLLHKHFNELSQNSSSSSNKNLYLTQVPGCLLGFEFSWAQLQAVSCII